MRKLMNKSVNASYKKLATTSLLVFLTACEVGPDYERPKIAMPDLNAKEEIAEFVANKWWSVFSDVTLNNLEERALKYNADMKIAIANVEMAAAMAGVAIADLFPSIKASGRGNRSLDSKNTRMGKMLTEGRNATDYSAGFDASYEIDFWGKYRRANEAARANLLSAKAGKEVALLAVTAGVAKAYFQLRSLEAKLAIAERTLKIREGTCAVYKSRFQNGYCSEFDYLRVQAEMASVKTTVLNLESGLAKAENALSVLIGANPREIVARRTAKSQAIERLRIPSTVPQGLPSDILARRPDVLIVEGQLIAANAEIGKARAAYFPSISLTGAYGFESMSLGRLFAGGSEMMNFGAGIYLPIFNGGKIRSLNKAAEANYRLMLAEYEKSIQNAFRDALDALISNRKTREIVISRTRQVNALKKSYAIAKRQKEVGLIGLIDLLDVERNLLGAEMELVEALQSQLNATVDLCKALGGGWKA
ncbi:MAG: efflux transporter outer membrane subunit [Holosporaceae bacterium]|jgi:multidrug efflux system outer membrane protein|nr:efflux transporter outer membrane subunit [Holosporaceae bacterium]